MASLTMAGQSGASTTSFPALDRRVHVCDRETPRVCPVPPSAAGCHIASGLAARGVRLVFVQGGSGLQFAAVVEDFDAPLSVLETRMAEPRQLDAALVECQGRLEREIAVFQFLDD